ncbi:ATP-binding protein, partial [Bacillaceae bacterium SIJ1]|nr:ATP-binding protein [Litoribacterium kuwaitense]
MTHLIEEHAKRLKLSWIREHYHEVKAETHEEFLLTLFEKEIEQREERKLNLLIKKSCLPDIFGKQMEWHGIHMNGSMTRDEILGGGF